MLAAIAAKPAATDASDPIAAAYFKVKPALKYLYPKLLTNTLLLPIDFPPLKIAKDNDY
jgi:hypothetical protein